MKKKGKRKGLRGKGQRRGQKGGCSKVIPKWGFSRPSFSCPFWLATMERGVKQGEKKDKKEKTIISTFPKMLLSFKTVPENIRTYKDYEEMKIKE